MYHKYITKVGRVTYKVQIIKKMALKQLHFQRHLCIPSKPFALDSSFPFKNIQTIWKKIKCFVVRVFYSRSSTAVAVLWVDVENEKTNESILLPNNKPCTGKPQLLKDLFMATMKLNDIRLSKMSLSWVFCSWRALSSLLLWQAEAEMGVNTWKCI